MMREFTREQRARALKHQRFSHDSFERLWLIIAFISSTEPRVIVYNAQHCKNAIEFSSWWRAALNVLITLVCILHIKTILFGLFFFWSLGSCIKKPLGSKIWGATAEIAFREERYFGWVHLWLSAPSTLIRLWSRACERREFPFPAHVGVRSPPLHRSKSDQIAPLNSAPRSSTISSRSGEIVPRSLKFKITLHA